jgi:hypothetical protein
VAGQVEHAVDAGRLINAIAEGGADSFEAGYGGGREFPHLETGLRCGNHRLTGHPFPQPLLEDGGFDRKLGDGIALVTTASTDISADVMDRWAAIDARRVDTRADLFPNLVGDGTVVVVRPDRYIAAITRDLVSTSAEFAELGLAVA